MKVAIYDTHKFDQKCLSQANAGRHGLRFLETKLDPTTAALAAGCRAVCCFANDKANAETLEQLKALGIELIALRTAGYNQVDLKAAGKLGLIVTRVPSYSPHAIAEYAVALLQTLNRGIHRAHNRVRELNFDLDGLEGFDLHGKTIGIVGTGKIGRICAQIFRGYDCEVLAMDTQPDKAWADRFEVSYVSLKDILQRCDVISLHLPLTPETKHLFDHNAFESMKPKAILINTGRGALVDSQALIHALKTRRLGGAALDVYEEEASIFFRDHSTTGIDDDLLARLLTFPNVLLTSHQAFLTHEALDQIAATTIGSLSRYEDGSSLEDVVVRALPLA